MQGWPAIPHALRPPGACLLALAIPPNNPWSHDRPSPLTSWPAPPAANVLCEPRGTANRTKQRKFAHALGSWATYPVETLNHSENLNASSGRQVPDRKQSHFLPNPRCRVSFEEELRCCSWPSAWRQLDSSNGCASPFSRRHHRMSDHPSALPSHCWCRVCVAVSLISRVVWAGSGFTQPGS